MYMSWIQNLYILIMYCFIVIEDEEYECVSVIFSYIQDVKYVVWYLIREMFVLCSYDNIIKLFKEEIDDWICCNILEFYIFIVWKISFDQIGYRIVFCSDDKILKIW